MEKGIIYVMTTIVPGLVKIGKTKTEQFNNRMYILESNGYRNVSGLKRAFAIEVDDYNEKEILIDDIFSKSRVSDTELFSLNINMVIQLLSALDGKQIYPENESKEEVFIEATEAKESSLIPDGEYTYITKKYNGTLVVKKGIFILKSGALMGQLSEKSVGKWTKLRKIVKMSEDYLAEDVECSSPSMAASFLSGSNKDGWICWKDSKDNLIDIYRKNDIDEE